MSKSGQQSFTTTVGRPTSNRNDLAPVQGVPPYLSTKLLCLFSIYSWLWCKGVGHTRNTCSAVCIHQLWQLGSPHYLKPSRADIRTDSQRVFRRFPDNCLLAGRFSKRLQARMQTTTRFFFKSSSLKFKSTKRCQGHYPAPIHAAHKFADMADGSAFGGSRILRPTEDRPGLRHEMIHHTSKWYSLSSLSPIPNTSWIFRVMICCTSWRSSCSLFRFRCVFVSWYSFLVFWMKVSAQKNGWAAWRCSSLSSQIVYMAQFVL